jgi:hypothetical protein
LYGAPVCAATIQTTKPAFDLLLHVGDVYYSGLPGEVRDRFLALWPNVPNAISRALNSNHEMYSGGYGYFGQTLPQFGQAASPVAMQNDHWLVIGLDTGYAEHDLAHDQAAWVMRRVEEAGNRRVVLFSHHQPFSIFEKQGPKLVSALDPLLKSGKVLAWYWGHEHRCVVYDRDPKYKMYGRCIGHSGFPYDRDNFGSSPKVETTIGSAKWMRTNATADAPSALVLDGPNPYILGYEEKFGPNGYATIDLLPDRLIETVRDPNGVELWRAELK